MEVIQMFDLYFNAYYNYIEEDYYLDPFIGMLGVPLSMEEFAMMWLEEQGVYYAFRE